MPDLLRNIFSKLTGGLWQRTGGQGWTRYRLLLPGSRFDYEREAGDFWSNPVVGLCVDWLGNRFPRPRFHVSRVRRSGDYEPLGRHPLADLWNRPNPYYTRRTMEKAVGLSLKVDGNAYIHTGASDGNPWHSYIHSYSTHSSFAYLYSYTITGCAGLTPK